MNRQALAILFSALVLIAGTSVFLKRLQGSQRLGTPGVTVASGEVTDPEGAVLMTNRVELPAVLPGYTSELQPVTRLEYDWLPKDTLYGRRRYIASDGFVADLNVILMGADRTSIHQAQYCLPGQGWVIERSEKILIPIKAPLPYELPAMKLVISRSVETKSGEKQKVTGMYIYWFVSANEITSDHERRMWWLARDLLKTGVLQRWAYVACYAIYQPEQEAQVTERLRNFLTLATPEFQRTPVDGPGRFEIAQAAIPGR